MDDSGRPTPFAFTDTKPSIPDSELIADLRRVAASQERAGLSQRFYREHGSYSTTAIKRRFKSWNGAIAVAGLTPIAQRNIPEDELFENLRSVWVALGRQPRKREMATPLSKFRSSSVHGGSVAG